MGSELKTVTKLDEERDHAPGEDLPRRSPTAGKVTGLLSKVTALLSKPWIGPSISLTIVVPLSAAGLFFSTATYFRQASRWQHEDDRAIRMDLRLQTQLIPGGFRWGLVEFFGIEPMQLERVSIISPQGALIAWTKNGPPNAEPENTPARSLDISRDEPLAISPPNSGSAVGILVHLPQTPNDEGTLIEMEGTIRELGGQKRTFTKSWRAIVPRGAQKSTSQ
ncbi:MULTISPECIES: hypothetical protein [unclassified Bradyrhizobium]|uniref:hypothetical protein n=1 Tax=unclassified Bradyrhizobium TaxID=2631580 RepID=UPI0028E3308D|nr:MULTISPECIES: hypothetical protein [unclassified Bradyrhizobium]